jgi:glycerol-3-phosphate dehydrogenase
VGAPSTPPSELSRKDEVWIGESGMITVAGGKLTGFRKMAETVIGHVAAASGIGPGPAPPVHPLPGGDVDPDLSRAAAGLARHDCVPAAVAERLVRLYGAEAGEVLRLGADPLTPGGLVVRGEVAWAVRVEAAATLADVLYRRTRAAPFLPAERSALVEPVGAELAALAGWDRRRRDEEEATVRRLFDAELAFAAGDT